MHNTFVLGSGDCTGVKMATLRAIMVCRERGLVSFVFRLGPYAGVVKRVLGGGGCARSSRTFFFNVVTLRNRNKSSNTLAITIKVCQFQTQVFVASWFGGN